MENELFQVVDECMPVIRRRHADTSDRDRGHDCFTWQTGQLRCPTKLVRKVSEEADKVLHRQSFSRGLKVELISVFSDGDPCSVEFQLAGQGSFHFHTRSFRPFSLVPHLGVPAAALSGSRPGSSPKKEFDQRSVVRLL